jgi:hypothetical protein
MFPEESWVMTSDTPRGVASGLPFRVVLVADHSPSSLAEFAEAEDFTMDMNGSPSLVRGAGRVTDADVRFHEKDLDHDGKDVRVWCVTRQEAGASPWLLLPLAVRRRERMPISPGARTQ